MRILGRAAAGQGGRAGQRQTDQGRPLKSWTSFVSNVQKASTTFDLFFKMKIENCGITYEKSFCVIFLKLNFTLFFYLIMLLSITEDLIWTIFFEKKSNLDNPIPLAHAQKAPSPFRCGRIWNVCSSARKSAWREGWRWAGAPSTGSSAQRH